MKRKYLYILAISFFTLTSSLFTASAQPNNVNVSQSAIFDCEPYLAVNPTNSNNIVVAWMGVTINPARISIKTKSSFDGGVTWGNYYVQPHFSPTYGSADVSMAFKNDGKVYLSYIDYRKSPDSGGIYVTHSADGGITWSGPVQAYDGLNDDPGKLPIDRPWIAIDNSGTANDGMLYLTSKPAYWIPPPNRPYLKTSSDSGQTWSTYRYIDTINYLVGNTIIQPMPSPTVSADGALCIAYPSYDPSQSVFGKFFFAKSYSRGATFTYHDLLVNPPTTTDTNLKLGYKLVANPANANQLCLAGIGNYTTNDPDVLISTTNDGGTTWSNLIRVNDDALGNGKYQDMVWASYGNNGVLCLTWRDRRNGSGTDYMQPSDTYCAVSFDNGATFKPNFRLSNTTVPFDTVLYKKGNDFMSCQLVNDSINACWGDVRTGKLNIFFAKTSDSTGMNAGIVQIASEDLPTLDVYPNPVSNSVILTNYLFNDAGTKLQITDAAGKIVYETNNIPETITINCSEFKPGVYLIKVSSEENKYFVRKVVKQQIREI